MKKITLDGFSPHSTQVFLVRHGESDFNGMNRIQGHLDSELTPRGLRQVRKLSRRLRGLGIRRIYSSDLGRAMATTRIIAKSLGAEIRPDRRLREIHLGAWEGLSPEEVNARFRRGYDRWRQSPSRTIIPRAERTATFHRRVRLRIEGIIKEERGNRILVVTHGGVIASVLSYWLKADFDRVLLNIKLDNSGLTLLERTSMRTKIHAINDVSHLSRRDLNEKNVFTEAP